MMATAEAFIFPSFLPHPSMVPNESERANMKPRSV